MLDYSIIGPLTPSISPVFYGWTGTGGSSSNIYGVQNLKAIEYIAARTTHDDMMSISSQRKI
jgi:hypothetical protein